jgi:Cell division protein FtsQ/DivIB, C-terminal
LAVAVAKKKQRKRANSSQWGFRLAGIVLCAFFVLGVITGLSRPGHMLALRIHALLGLWPHPSGSSLIPGGFTAIPGLAPSTSNDAVALLKREDGFYVLNSDGELRGPIAPESSPDLPILSGRSVAKADAAQLILDAAVMVRAEADLNQLVSEMKAGPDGTATLFLEHTRAAVVIDVSRSGAEIERAARILRMWRGHQQMLAVIDLTTPDEAVVRLKPADSNHAGGTSAVQDVAFESAPPATINDHHPGRAR